MNMRLYQDILDNITPFLQPYLEQFHRVTPIIPRPDQVLIQGIANKEDAGKTLISLTHDAAKASGYALFVTDLVPSFYQRLVSRGATIVEANEAVQITHNTDLTHKPV